MATQHDAPAREQATGGRFARAGAPERAPGTSAARSGRATAALILSILGCVFALFFALVGLILSVVGVILAATARSDIARRGMAGAGMAKAALIVGIVGIVLNIASMVAAAAIIAGN